MHSTKTIIRRLSQAVFVLLLTMAVNGVTYGQTQDESLLLGMTEFSICQQSMVICLHLGRRP